MQLSIMAGLYAVCKLDHDAAIPDWAREANFVALVRTPDELTVVCPQTNLPDEIIAEPGWVALKVNGPLEFELVGVLAALSSTLAGAGVSIFAISTYDTDYILLKETCLGIALTALEEAGHSILNG